MFCHNLNKWFKYYAMYILPHTHTPLKANVLWALVWNEHQGSVTSQLSAKDYRGGWLIEHSKHPFSLKGFFSTFMELCLKKINTVT